MTLVEKQKVKVLAQPLNLKKGEFFVKINSKAISVVGIPDQLKDSINGWRKQDVRIIRLGAT